MEAFLAFIFFSLLVAINISLVMNKYSKTKVTYLNRTLPRLKWYRVRLPILDGYITLKKLRIEGVKLIEKEMQKYGSLVIVPFLNSNALFVSDVDIVKKILLSSDPEHLNKPKVYKTVLSTPLMDGLLAAEYNVWSVHRKAITPAATYKGFPTYVKFMNNEAKNLVEKAWEFSGQSNVNQLDNEQIKKLIDSCLLNIITNMLMGTEDSDVSGSSRAVFHTTFHKYKDLIMERFLHPEEFIPLVWQFHPRKRNIDACAELMNEFSTMIANTYRLKAADKPINEKDNETGVKPFQCMVEQLIQAGLSNKEVIDEINTLLGTGHETLTAALDMLIFHLAKTPDCQEKCFVELQTVLENKQGNLEKSITMDDLTQLKYLERCVLEAMRITPTVPLFLRRLDTPMQITEDTFIEANQVVFISPWAIHRNQDLYPQPEKFDPDRFLAENVKQRHTHAYIPFSMGPRNCIGFKIAMLEMKMIMAWILRFFSLSTEDELDNVKLLFDITLKPERMFDVKFTRRHAG